MSDTGYKNADSFENNNGVSNPDDAYTSDNNHATFED